jgi:uncharacterized membrane protein HdeD (DUF308 family)
MSPTLTAEEIATGDEVADQLQRNWGWYLVAGIIGVLLGFVVIEWRTETLYAIAYFAGAIFLFIGLVRLVDVFLVKANRWISLLAAVIFLAIGVLILVWPHITLFILALLIALGFVMWGIFELIKAFAEPREAHWWLSLIGGIVSLIIAVWTVRHPGSALQVIILLLGIWIMVWGVVEIVAAFSARHARRHWDALKAQMV